MKCSFCKHNESAKLVNYGELTAIGGEIEVNDCFAEFYDEDCDSSDCANFEILEE